MKSIIFFFSLLFSLILLKSRLIAQTPISLTEQADLEFEKGNYNKAVLLYNKLIFIEPNNASNYSGRAYSYYNMKEYKKAISDCNTGLKFEKKIVTKYYLHKLKGDCYYNLEKWEDAIISYDSFLEFLFDDIEVNSCKSEALFKLEKYNEAIENTNELFRIKGEKNIPKNDLLNFYVINSFSYLFIDSLHLAKKNLDLANKIDPDNVNVARLTAEIFFKESNYSKAIEIYDKMLAKDSSLFYFIYFRAQAYYYLENYDLAIKDFIISKKYFSESPELFYKLGYSEMKLKNYNSAVKELLVCIRLNPKSSTYFNQLSWTYFLMKKYTEGLIYANKAILLDQKNTNALDTRGCIYYKTNNFAKSISDFNKTLSLDSTYSNSYYYRGLAYLKTHNNVKACKDWEFLSKQKEYKSPEGEKTIEQLMKESCL